ncbi:GIY-YIG nuclease family protein [Stappia sp. BW2]|uniref:GIY-YIG nuclease family protein n=1 Tax=Stappia sp. BW2 TaxID=2592622 RepID=UPI00257027B9|nr:GIY-YIG nuclease family protein [Stappia sp. BW2]
MTLLLARPVEARNSLIMPAAVYILTSNRNGMLYIGVTTNLSRRLYEHRNGLIEGFSKTYGVTRLVHAETFDRIEDAILREKQLKKWRRSWKIDLIEKSNPEWQDLTETVLL